jgi:hypothetical protein
MAKDKSLPALTDAELKQPITSKNFFRRAEHFIQVYCAGQRLPVISPGSPTWLSWREYFDRHLGWMPLMMQKIIDDAPDKPAGFTVPAMDPQTFDGSFREREGWKPPAPQLVMPRQHRETLEEIKRRFGPNYGIKDLAKAIEKKRPYQSLTDDELRRLYPRHDETDAA